MNKTKKKKLEKWQIGLLLILLVFLLFIGLGVFIFKHYYNMIDIQKNDNILPEQEIQTEIIEEVEEPKEEDIFAGKEISEKAFNIMLVGVDTRENDFEGRTDSMILVHVNPETKKIVTTSFLRDIYLEIPGYGSNRLNAAYVFGGPNLLLNTISHNFGINAEHYVTLNFWLAIDILDDIGGVDINITADEIEYMNHYMAEHNSILGKPEGTDYLSAEDAGLRHLNGNQALAFARIRYIGTDFARSSRQREIISICIEKAKHMDVKEINELLKKYLPCVKTNLTEQDVTTLLFMSLKLNEYTKESNVVPMDDTWEVVNINGMSVLSIDCVANANAWYDIIKE